MIKFNDNKISALDQERLMLTLIARPFVDITKVLYLELSCSNPRQLLSSCTDIYEWFLLLFDSRNT